MKRISTKLFALLGALLLILNTAIPTFAAGSVTYDGTAREFIFAPGSDQSPTDLFDGLKGVMPGDSLTQKITEKNDASKEVKFNIYMRSLGAHEDSAELLSKLHMTVAKTDNNTMAYMFDASADQTDGLTDWVLLGTLYSGGEVELEVTLDIPIELGDEFQDAVGYIDWQFRVEELPVEPDDPKPPPTGDTGYLYVYAILISICVIAVVGWIRKRRKSADQY